MAIVIQNNGPTARSWASTLCEWCAPPGGCSNCLVGSCCPCCAAGEIAKAAGKDYCMSCFIVPSCLPCLAPCVWAWDREAFAKKFGIPDESCVMNCCLFMFCTGCMLCQERNTLIRFQTDGVLQQVNNPQSTVILVTPGQQQMMGAAPAYA